MKEEWIKDLKVGDEVIIVTYGCDNYGHVERVEKVNKATVRVCGTLFSIIDGFERCSGWHRSRITQCIEEAKDILCAMNCAPGPYMKSLQEAVHDAIKQADELIKQLKAQ